jgi:hypothetical protein
MFFSDGDDVFTPIFEDKNLSHSFVQRARLLQITL